MVDPRLLIESDEDTGRAVQQLVEQFKRVDILNLADPSRQQNARTVKTSYAGLNPRTRTIMFRSQDVQGSGQTWEQFIRLIATEKYEPFPRVLFRVTDPAVAGGVQGETEIEVYCECPDFLYGGYQYKGWTQGYGIRKEPRYPDIRNPNLQGSVCKHLYAALQVMPNKQEEIYQDYQQATDQDHTVVRRKTDLD